MSNNSNNNNNNNNNTQKFSQYIFMHEHGEGSVLAQVTNCPCSENESPNGSYQACKIQLYYSCLEGISVCIVTVINIKLVSSCTYVLEA
jgi:hypothetical protein